MKFTKLSILAGTATGALFLAGCTIPGQQLQNREQEQTQEQVQNEMKEMAQIMEKGGSAYCELIDKEGNKLNSYKLPSFLYCLRLFLGQIFLLI